MYVLARDKAQCFELVAVTFGIMAHGMEEASVQAQWIPKTHERSILCPSFVTSCFKFVMHVMTTFYHLNHVWQCRMLG